ncbi:MAG: hypothetical protein RMX35_32470 [Nostoc sp. DcaGUA01]|nr:hypothetical protein [Nostoc sp. DcaGUA01]
MFVQKLNSILFRLESKNGQNEDVKSTLESAIRLWCDEVAGYEEKQFTDHIINKYRSSQLEPLRDFLSKEYLPGRIGRWEGKLYSLAK